MKYIGSVSRDGSCSRLLSTVRPLITWEMATRKVTYSCLVRKAVFFLVRVKQSNKISQNKTNEVNIPKANSPTHPKGTRRVPSRNGCEQYHHRYTAMYPSLQNCGNASRIRVSQRNWKIRTGVRILTPRSPKVEIPRGTLRDQCISHRRVARSET